MTLLSKSLFLYVLHAWEVWVYLSCIWKSTELLQNSAKHIIDQVAETSKQRLFRPNHEHQRLSRPNNDCKQRPSSKIGKTTTQKSKSIVKRPVAAFLIFIHLHALLIFFVGTCAGYGILRTANNEVYQGYMYDHKRHGEGTQVYRW